MPVLLRNISSLFLVHIVRLILPIALIPVLTSRVSADSFGLYIFSVSLATWLCLFIEYGFNISGTRLVAQTRNKLQVVEVIVGVHSAKLLLTLITLPMVFLIYFCVPLMQQNPLWLFFSWMSAIAIAFVPTFYFQGIEKTQSLAKTEVVSGVCLFVSIYFFVNRDADATYIMLLYFLARVIVLVLTQLATLRSLSAKIYKYSYKQGINQLKIGVHCFILQTLAALYTSFNVVMLGFWVNALSVGIYGAGERLIRAGLGFIAQASNAVFPRITKLKTQGSTAYNTYRYGALAVFFIIGLIGVWLTHKLSPIIVPWLFNGKFNQAVEVVNLLAWVIPAIALSNVLGFQFLLIESKERILNLFIALGGILNVTLAMLFVPEYGHIAMAWSWLVTEWFITLSLAVVVIYNLISTKNSSINVALSRDN